MYTAYSLPLKCCRSIRLVVLSILLLLAGQSFSQKYNFTHYDIENGLAQSQVLKLYQDKDHYLWMGSYGGASRFDGKEFISYTKADGLEDNIVTAVLKDHRGKVWLGTEAGLSCINGRKIQTFKLPGTDKSWIRSIVEDADGKLWFTKKSKLYTLSGNNIVPYAITGPNEYVVSLSNAHNGKLYAAVCGSGIFSLDKGKWQKRVQIKDSLLITKIVADAAVPNKFYLLSPKQIYLAQNGAIKPFQHPFLDSVHEPFFSLEQDAEGSLWVGTNNGAYYLKNNAPVHFITANGFTNNPVNDIYRDFEDNIWLATDGAGVFKYDGNSFVSYEKFDAINRIVMAIARDNSGNTWMGCFNNGIVKFDGKTFTTLRLPSDNQYAQNINCIYNAPGKGLLIGTQHGLWSHNGNTFTHLTENSIPEIVRSVITDKNGTIWMAAPRGCFYIDGKGQSVQIKGADFSNTAVIEAGEDSIITGSNHGIQLITNKALDRRFAIPELQNSSILCLLKYKGILLAGTFGDGLFLIDLKTRHAKKFNIKNGLYSNDIYSLAIDENGLIWTGTGRGVNRVLVDPKMLTLKIINHISPKALIECNQNAIMHYGNTIWIGATKGIYLYNTRRQSLQQKKPYINIQTVRVFNQEVVNGKLQPAKVFESKIPATLKLNSFQNRIVISFRGIYFTNPDDVTYQYRLKGLDEEFSQPLKTNTIEYPSLLPGTYVFEIKAMSGGRASNIQSLTFEITPPFYKTIAFQISMLLMLIVGIVALQYYWTYRKAKQKQILEAIKHEEQIKIRRQTAEDFHDDIGNKLTRISILSEILNKKLGDGSDDQKSLVQQIKENAATLYTGTKDILWALDPQSDNLYEILVHIKEQGHDLFDGTGVEIHFKGIDKKYQKLQLPMEYSRNISMIFKEIFSNILKHANTSSVSFAAVRASEGIQITVTDNGIGYDPNGTCKGRGINNIKMRAKRINGSVEFASGVGSGSKTTLTINLNNYHTS